jgi:3-hydroxyacyl-[acyl-carrier-protein] dehydratase
MASGVIDHGLDPEILEQVRAILRRDIKLGPDHPLPIDARLFGGEVDLDSLDMLLLITSIEKQFKVRIADRAAGEVAFQSVGALTKYVQDRIGNTTVASSPQNTPTPIDWLSQLPHGEGFRFISRIIEVRPGEMARGIWSLTGSEPFFAAHFPGNPIVPGVLIVEALAQISGLAGSTNSGRSGKLAHVDVRFERAIAPPTEIELNAKIINILGSLQRCEVVAKVGANVIAQGTITLTRTDGGNA